MKFSNMRVLITGGSGGIGGAIGAELLARGASVLLVGRDEAVLARAALRHAAHGDRIGTVAADLTIPADRRRMCEAAMAWYGGVNVLVNSAGVSHFALFGDQSSTQLDVVLTVNVVAPLQLCRELLPHLAQQVEGRILNIGSVFGTIGYPGYAVYSASKFALRGFTEALRRELAGTSIRVQYIAPRATRTRMNSAAVMRMNAHLGVAIDAPERVAQAACSLLESGRAEAVVGWPERFFARMNAALPGVVDRAVRRQLAAIRHYASGAGPPPASTEQPLTRA
jgi:short-subunit dehydrogenase